MPWSRYRELLVDVSDDRATEDVGAVEADLLLISRRWQALAAQRTGDVPLVHFSILRVVIRMDEISMGDLAASMLLDASTMTRHVESLVNANMLTRHPSDTDKRQIMIRATPEGVAESERIREQLHGLTGEVLASVDPLVVASLRQSLHLLRNALLEFD